MYVCMYVQHVQENELPKRFARITANHHQIKYTHNLTFCFTQYDPDA